ncbi:MAG: chemotaxis protein CheW [Acidobacteriota bacterium]
MPVFEGLRGQLVKVDAVLQGDAAYDARRIEEILQARARALARPLQKDTQERTAVLIIIRLGDQRYAIPLVKVVEIHPFESFAPVPGTPKFIKGVVNVRGMIYTVLDLCEFFSVRPDDASQTSQSVLIVEDGQTQLGLLVDEVIGISYYSPADIHSVKLNLPTIKAEHISGTTADGLAVLNMEELLADRRLLVEDE